jgi:hypothetical protein
LKEKYGDEEYKKQRAKEKTIKANAISQINTTILKQSCNT